MRAARACVSACDAPSRSSLGACACACACVRACSSTYVMAVAEDDGDSLDLQARRHRQEDGERVVDPLHVLSIRSSYPASAAHASSIATAVLGSVDWGARAEGGREYEAGAEEASSLHRSCMAAVYFRNVWLTNVHRHLERSKNSLTGPQNEIRGRTGSVSMMIVSTMAWFSFLGHAQNLARFLT